MKPSNEPFLLKASFISFSLASAMIVSVFSASAEGYVRLTASKDQNTAFADAKWSETVEDPSTRDYLVAGKYSYKSANGEVCPARSLTFGIVGGDAGEFYDYYNMTFENNGVIFANGKCHTRASDTTLKGLVRFTSPQSAPFIFYNDDYRAKGITFAGTATADSTVGIQIESRPTNSFYLAFNDSSAFAGTIVITSKFNAADYVVSGSDKAYLKLKGPSFPGTIVLNDKTWVENTVACEVGKIVLRRGGEIKATGALTVDEFVLEDFADLTLRIDANAGTSSTYFTAKDTLTFVGERLKINLTGTPLRSSVLAATADPVSIPLLTVPSTFDLEDFDLPIFSVTGKNPTFKMVENGQAKTLTAVYYPYIKGTNKVYGGGNLKVAEATVNDSISAGMWADNLPVHGDAYYAQEKVSGTTSFLSPFDLENSYAFPGTGLIFGDTTALTLQGVEFEVPVISFLSSLSIWGLYSPATVQTLKFGEMVIADNRTITLNFRGGSTLILKGPIRGDETSTILVTGNSGSTSSCETFNLLDGDNRAFKGKINVYSYATRATESRGVTTLYVKDGKNLGGARSEFTYDALSINNKGFLKVIDSATLDEPTRGIYLDSSATLTDKDAGVNCVKLSVTNETGMLTIKETITLNATIRKTGAGALALGGALKFLDANTNLTDTVPAREDLHKLIMTGGQLKPLAARSLDGLDIVFSNKVSKLAVGLTIDAATTDAELAQRGLIDLKTENNPIVAVTQSGTIPVSFENLPADPKEAFSVPICTVRKSAAADVLAVLVPAEKRVMLGNVKAKITLSASESFTLDGFEAVTIKADVTPPAGMLLLVR